jgi:hypothetical protein
MGFHPFLDLIAAEPDEPVELDIGDLALCHPGIEGGGRDG